MKENKATINGWIFTTKEHYRVYESLVAAEPNQHILFRQKYNAICQAFEMSLKTFLISSGESISQVRKIKHDLMELILISYTKYGLMISPEVVKIIEVINPDYKLRKFLYFEKEHLLPENIDSLVATTQMLISKITFDNK